HGGEPHPASEGDPLLPRPKLRRLDPGDRGARPGLRRRPGAADLSARRLSGQSRPRDLAGRGGRTPVGADLREPGRAGDLLGGALRGARTAGRSMKLKGRTVIVTGASRGIGRSVAQKFGEEGAKVALVARSEKGLLETAARLQKHGVHCVALPTD